VLEEVVSLLSPIVATMEPKPLQIRIDYLFSRLADEKVTTLVNWIRWRQRYGINQLGEWTAEGTIAQIDEIVADVRARLSKQWQEDTSPKKYGPYFQLYHGADQAARVTLDVGIQRWRGSEQSLWYKEAAILKSYNDLPLERIFELTKQVSWWFRPEVLWYQNDSPLRITEPGDVLVSLLFGQAWIIGQNNMLLMQSSDIIEGAREMPNKDAGSLLSTTAKGAAPRLFMRKG
jgi:hypothetical protein